MSDESTGSGTRERMAKVVRLVVTWRERAARSPRIERVLKRLIWRYTQGDENWQGSADVQE